jgi:RNA polymerase sigma-70 factor (ECF subfamily)
MPLTDSTEDARLLTEMGRGNAAAFAALYRRHRDPLFRFAVLRCGSADTAADVVQEVFLALLTDTLRFDPARGALQGFLIGVARNLLLKRDDARRRYVGNSERDDECEPGYLLVDPAPGPMARLLANQQAERVRAALQQLAPHYRDVVILYEMHDLSYVEIADVCHIDIGTVRSRLSRGRARLAQLLADDALPADADQPQHGSPCRQEARL